MLCFSMICVSAGSKSNLAKAAGAEVLKNCTPLYCSEKHIFNQNVPLATCSDHCLKLRCGEIARRCSEKHILKSKCTKHVRFGPLFEFAMWKNCTPL